MEQLRAIGRELSTALHRGGWSLPADRVTFLANEYVMAGDEQPAGGCGGRVEELNVRCNWRNASGTLEVDARTQLTAAISACNLRQDLWKPENGSRPGESCVLMRKVLTSVATATAARHRHTQTSLRGLKVLQTELFQTAAGTKRRTDDDAEAYSRRRSRELHTFTFGLDINELSVVALHRHHVWAGQVARHADMGPRELLSQVLNHESRQEQKARAVRNGKGGHGSSNPALHRSKLGEPFVQFDEEPENCVHAESGGRVLADNKADWNSTSEAWASWKTGEVVKWRTYSKQQHMGATREKDEGLFDTDLEGRVPELARVVERLIRNLL